MRRFTQQVALGLAAWSLGMASAFASKAPLPPGSAAWVIESADYTADIRDQIVRFEGRLTVQVLQDGWVEVPLTLNGATVTAISLERKSADAHILPRSGTYLLGASKKGTYRVRVTGATRLVQESQLEGIQLGIPRATFSTMTVRVPRKDVELRPEDQLYVDAQADGARAVVTLIARLGASEYVDIRWRAKPAAPAHIEPVFYGDVHTLVTLEEEIARLIATVDYRVTQGEIKQFQLTMPQGLNILNIRGSAIEDWRITEAEGHKTLVVTLSTPLKETAYRLVLEGEAAIDRAGTSYQLPEIILVGAKQERGYVAVARAGNIELTPGELAGITRVDVRELPGALATSAASPAILAFRYHQHPYAAGVGITRHQDHPVLAAIAEHADLVSVISRQGDVLTRAAYMIKANKKQFLEVRLPGDATLWSCIVDGASVKPVQGAEGTLLVPLAAGADPGHAIPVELVYVERHAAFQGIRSFTLVGPRLDVPVTVANWALHAPHSVRFLRTAGNLEQGAAAFGFLDEPFMQTAHAAEGSSVSSPQAVRADVFAFRKSRLAQNAGGEDKDERHQVQEGVYDAAVLMASTMSPSSGSERELGFVNGRLTSEERGILPLKIRLPKTGHVYRFSRLMTTDDALRLEATVVRTPEPWVGWSALGLVASAFGAVVLLRRRPA